MPGKANARYTILFVDGIWTEKMGIMALIPQLQTAGFDVRLLLTRNNKKLLREVAKTDPDFVAFSVTTGYHVKALTQARLLKQHFPKIRTIFGGAHITYFPDTVLDPAVDMGFRGECDLALPRGLKMMLDGAGAAKIPNAVGRTVDSDGQPMVVFGPLDDLVDVDGLPFPDRELYYKYRFFATNFYKTFVVTRGCPYNCAYCFNHKLRSMYLNKGRFLRRRSPELVVEEGMRVKRQWGLGLAGFDDDLPTHDKAWLADMLRLWKEKVGVPYNINATARELADPELVRLLKDTGVWSVSFGVESGDEELRRKVLNKPVSDAHIIRAGELLKRFDIPFQTYNMLGLPNETIDQAIKTILLNRKIGARCTKNSIFQPYPGTVLGDSMDAVDLNVELGYERAVPRGPEGGQMEKLQKLGALAMSTHFNEKTLRFILKFPRTPVHDLVFWYFYSTAIRKCVKTGYLRLAEVGLRTLTDLF